MKLINSAFHQKYCFDYIRADGDSTHYDIADDKLTEIVYLYKTCFN